MGCTYEVYNITLPESLKEDFKAYWKKSFEESFYWKDNGDLTESEVKDGKITLGFDDEPYFLQSCMEDSVLANFVDYCTLHPDVDMSFDYFTQFSVDGSCQFLNCTYSNGEVNGVWNYAPSDTQICCDNDDCIDEACDRDDIDPVIDITEFDPNKEYICPICGNPIDTEEYGSNKIHYTIMK